MNQSVMIKGNKNGLILWMDPSLSYETILEKIREKFQASVSFFRFKKPIAIQFEGRVLDHEQITEVINAIIEITSLQIAYVIDGDSAIETKFQQLMEEREEERRREEEEKNRLKAAGRKEDGVFYRGTLRSGQTVESDSSVIVLGDVNPGATVSAKGNVVVLGALKGYAFAGIEGDNNAIIVALDMKPMQLRIGDKIARKEDEETKGGFLSKKKKKKLDTADPQMAFIDQGSIYIEPISKTLIHELMI